jgi:glycosylphosphatidylinositol deacylase
VTLTKEKDTSSFTFDYFTVDLNSELSGLYGYVLSEQREFIVRSVERIRSLYPDDYHSVVLIGHSIGGLIAVSAAQELNTKLVVTLATPHKRAPLILDPEIDLFYRKVSRATPMATTVDEESSAFIVSIAGGDRDILVREELTLAHYNHIQTTVSFYFNYCWRDNKS